MVLPVKVSVDKITGLAHTVDITPLGARLSALRTQLQPGMIISLQRGTRKAEFRVEWVKQLAPNEFQAGIESPDGRRLPAEVRRCSGLENRSVGTLAQTFGHFAR